LDAVSDHVGKLEYAFTGPWHIIALLHGSSYSIKHCHNMACKEKKHSANLALYPPELIPFKPVDGANMCYGQLYKPIGEHPFKEAGITEFIPPTPFKVPANFIDVGDFKDFRWPTQLELIDELDPFPWHDEDKLWLIMSDDTHYLCLRCTMVLLCHFQLLPSPNPWHQQF
jgi:hypothetical protein